MYDEDGNLIDDVIDGGLWRDGYLRDFLVSTGSIRTGSTDDILTAKYGLVISPPVGRIVEYKPKCQVMDCGAYKNIGSLLFCSILNWMACNAVLAFLVLLALSVILSAFRSRG